MAHMTVEVDKSQDLQGELENWRFKRADGVFPVQV